MEFDKEKEAVLFPTRCHQIFVRNPQLPIVDEIPGKTPNLIPYLAAFALR